MTKQEILAQLQSLGTESIKKVLVKHGAREPFYGVKTEDLKKIAKKIKKDYALSLALFDTGISDAMYLAGLIVDADKMTKQDLQHWAEKAYWYLITEYPVAWAAAESKYGLELAQEWIESDRENIACAGWATLGMLASIKPDNEINIALFQKLMKRVEATIHGAPNRVRYTMNGFVICCGGCIATLTNRAKEAGKKIGVVKVNMGDTACKVPSIIPYLENMEAHNRIGVKRKTAKC